MDEMFWKVTDSLIVRFLLCLPRRAEGAAFGRIPRLPPLQNHAGAGPSPAPPTHDNNKCSKCNNDGEIAGATEKPFNGECCCCEGTGKRHQPTWG
mmetsp:Transcript_6224/g.16063  ORF Transcript_6224/g.16063 Transcript_6224/m.16063 type:complete len:95 (+) Transcript_6224:25-309(+)